MKITHCMALSIIMIISLLFGCSPSEQKGSSQTINKPKGANDFSDKAVENTDTIELVTDLVGGTNCVGGLDGFYILDECPTGGANISYIDYNSQTQIYLCNNPSCTHNDSKCTSWLENHTGSEPIFMNPSKSKLFIMSNRNVNDNTPGSILSLDNNGSNKKIIYKTNTNEMIFDAVACDGTFLYFNVLIIKDAMTEPTKELRQLNIENGDSKTLISYGNSDWLFGAYDDQLLILYYDSQGGSAQIGEFRYTTFCPETGVQKDILTYSYNDSGQPEHATFARPHDNNLYIVRPGNNYMASVVELDMRTGVERELTSQLPFFHIDGITFRGYNDGYIVYEITDFINLEKNGGKPVAYKYAINTATGDVIELTLKTSGSLLNEFYYLAADTGDGYLVQTEIQWIDKEITDNEGVPYTTSVETAIYSLIPKEDYWNNVAENAIPISNIGYQYE